MGVDNCPCPCPSPTSLLDILWGSGGGGGGGLTFKILKAFLFYYCVHSANGGGWVGGGVGHFLCYRYNFSLLSIGNDAGIW